MLPLIDYRATNVSYNIKIRQTRYSNKESWYKEWPSMTANYAEQIKCKMLRLNYHFAIHTLHVNPLENKGIRSDMG